MFVKKEENGNMKPINQILLMSLGTGHEGLQLNRKYFVFVITVGG